MDYLNNTMNLKDSLITCSDHLGSEADRYDMHAYNEALERAWADRFHGAEEVDKDLVELLANDLLEGRAGRDASGRGWMEVADARRAAARTLR